MTEGGETPTFAVCSSEDEYLDDSLPDLVIDAEGGASSSEDERFLDLINDHSLSVNNVDAFSSSSAALYLLDYYNDDSVHVDVNRVSYTDHSKLYISPAKSGVYRSYLSLLPSSSGGGDDKGSFEDVSTEGPSSETSFLDKFRALSKSDQDCRRGMWKEELLRAESEIKRIRNELESKVEVALKLKKRLGISFSWKERMGYFKRAARTKFSSSVSLGQF